MKILIAEASEVIRHGLHTIFAQDPRVLSIDEVENEEALSTSIVSLQPDLIVINQDLIKERPLLATRSFFVLAAEPDLAILKKIYCYGALGYFSLNASAEVLRTMLGVAQKSFFIDPGLGPWIMDATLRAIDLSSSRHYVTLRRRRCLPHESDVDAMQMFVGYLYMRDPSARY